MFRPEPPKVQRPVPVQADSLRIMTTRTCCLIVSDDHKRFDGDLPMLVYDVGCAHFARPEAEALLADPELGKLRQLICDEVDPDDDTFTVIVGERTVK